MKNTDPSEPKGVNYLVQKSDPLLFLEELIPYTLSELKLIDIYLSRINSHDEGTCIITISLKEYMNLLNLKDMRINVLEESLDALSSKKVYIPEEYGFVYDPKHKSESNRIPLFKRVSLATNEDGSREIQFVCNEDVNAIFFNMDKNNIHFVQYVVKNTLRLKSVYSIFLYIHLKGKEYKGEWDISLNELKKDWLRVKSKTIYDDFKYFKYYILEKSVKEINEKTDIKVNYNCIKDGHTVVGINFTIEPNVDNVIEDAGFSSLDCKKEEEKPEIKGDNQPKQYVKRNKAQAEPGGTHSAHKAYDREFEEFWKAYPRKQDKGMALGKYKTCINAGYKPEELLTAAKKYAEQCARNHTEQKYIKTAKTFLGPSHPFEEFLDSVLSEEPKLTEQQRADEARIQAEFEKQLRAKMFGETNQGEEQD